MKKITGFFSVIEEAERALRRIEEAGFKPNDIKVYSSEKFDPIERNIGFPVAYFPIASNSFAFADGYNLTPMVLFGNNDVTSSTPHDLYHGKVVVEISCSDDEANSIGSLLRNNGAKEVKSE